MTVCSLFCVGVTEELTVYAEDHVLGRENQFNIQERIHTVIKISVIGFYPLLKMNVSKVLCRCNNKAFRRRHT